MTLKGQVRRFLFALPLKEHGETTQHVLNLSHEESKEALFELFKDRLKKEKHGLHLTRVNLPDFKVPFLLFSDQTAMFFLKIGTLDGLVAAGEDLAKFTTQFEGVVERLVGHLRALFANDEFQVASSLSIDDCKYMTSRLDLAHVFS